MDIFEVALEQKQLSEQYYHQLAEKAGSEGLRNILTMLADEEVIHYRTLEQMKANTSVEVTDTNVLADARDVFNQMRGSYGEFDFDISELELYKKAMDMEAESRKYYLQKAQEVDLPEQRDIFEALAKEENKHFIILKSIADFITAPDTFLENAEFFHLQGDAV